MTLAAAALAASVAAPASQPTAPLRHRPLQPERRQLGSDRISVGPNGPVLGTTVSSMGDTAIGAAVTPLQRLARQRRSDRVNADTVTVFSGGPAYAADIFEQLRLADDDNE
jgi:hypothetical protein